MNLSLGLLCLGALSLVTGAYLLAGAGVALVTLGVLCFAAEWLVK